MNCITCGQITESGRRKYCSEHNSSLSVRQKERDEQRQKEGLCRRCENPLAPNSKAFCATHLEMNRKQQKEHSERQKQAGMCKYCNEPLSPNSGVFCEVHRLQTNERSLSYERKKRAKLLCSDCKERIAMPRKSRCEVCQPIYQEWKNTHCQRKGCTEPIAEGLKHYCRIHADEANEKLAERRDRLQKENKCYFCQTPLGETEIGRNSLCARCRNNERKGHQAAQSVQI